MSRRFDPHLEWLSERGMRADDDQREAPQAEYEPCYMCVPVEWRMMTAEQAAAAGHPWPLKRVVSKHVTNRADPTEVVVLSCGHSII